MNKEQIGKIYNECELPFYWKAYKKDGSVLLQFEEGEELKENLYSEVDRNPENFKKFELVDLQNETKTYSIDLETGDFYFNNVIIKNNIDIKGGILQCIFWRKKAITLNRASQSVSYLYYTLGWQINIDGANIKREYKIFSNGDVQEILQKQHRKLFAQAKIVRE